MRLTCVAVPNAFGPFAVLGVAGMAGWGCRPLATIAGWSRSWKAWTCPRGVSVDAPPEPAAGPAVSRPATMRRVATGNGRRRSRLGMEAPSLGGTGERGTAEAYRRTAHC